MTALILTAVAVAAAANISLVAFVADRLTPTSSTSTVTAGELVLVNDNAPAAVKLAA
ncbi:hypothetical protein [Methylobacterium sp. E-045]|uniref:hypothetical protein n=1 Tax=Methylobacterium sp. E-045 TaxID=2836575 RepID=UPI001FB88729|nr:hypothetical protein [Methylobacterium sp. E-045]MCJ2128315.1 hypothetical protein [Methylobacterium sp. E-045]